MTIPQNDYKLTIDPRDYAKAEQLLTLSQISDINRRNLDTLVEYCGSMQQLGRMIGVSRTAIVGWSKRGAVSWNGVKAVLAHPTLGKKFTQEDLRVGI